jgi:glutathionylspermidine amidase/synthetase
MEINKKNGVSIYLNERGIDSDEYHFITYHGKEIKTGLKWQCVELARRYLILQYGISFPSVTNAYELFDLSTMFDVDTNQSVSCSSYKNSTFKRPNVGSLLIWDKNYDLNGTGHVAVITNVFDHSVQIIEQNNSTSCRTIPLVYSNGRFTIDEPHILGWITHL